MGMAGADLAFLIRGGPYSELSFQILGINPIVASFCSSKNVLLFRVVHSTTQFLIVTRNWVYVNQLK